MQNLQVLLMAILIALVVGSGTTGTIVYKYQTNKYERVIADASAKQQKAITQVTINALANERKNAQITAALDAKYTEEHRKLGLVQDEFTKYRSSNNSGLRITATRCFPAGATNSPSTGSTTTSPEASTGSAELSATTSEALESTARDADEMRLRLQIAQDYAKAIEAQRERLSKQ